jgi:hypothetical protein
MRQEHRERKIRKIAEITTHTEREADKETS